MDVEQNIKNNIKQYDTILIPDDGYLPAMGYTVGLYETYKHPEIFIVGMDHQVIKQLIDTVADKIKNHAVSFSTGVGYADIINTRYSL